MKENQPQYQLIYNSILKKINKGSYNKDEPIPSENELALKFNVSRMTARKSIDMLVNEGYLLRQKGKGTFITGRKNFIKPEISLSLRLKEEGIRIFSQVLTFEKTIDQPMEVRQALNLVEEEAYHIVRLRYANDVAAIIEESWIKADLFPEFKEEEASQSLTELVSNHKEVGLVNLFVEPHILKKKEAKLLSLKKDDIVLKVKGEIKSMEGDVILYSESIQNIAVLPVNYMISR